MTTRSSTPIKALWRGIATLADRAPVDTVHKHRLQHYTVFLLIGIPTMVVFGTYNLIVGNYPLALLVSLSALGLLIGWAVLHRVTRGTIVYRMNSALFGMLILYMLVIGGDEGSKILWMYVYPLVVFFLLGTREGLIWSGITFLAAGALIEDPFNWFPVYEYGAAFKVRFITTFLVVSAITFWFQHLRQSYFKSMEDKRAKLEQEQERLNDEIAQRQRAEQDNQALIADLMAALERVKTLSGLIPICAGCKKIRDDEGSWDQLESYLSKHSDAQFSHGFCPDCITRLYPDYRPAANDG